MSAAMINEARLEELKWVRQEEIIYIEKAIDATRRRLELEMISGISEKRFNDTLDKIDNLRKDVLILKGDIQIPPRTTNKWRDFTRYESYY